MNLQASERLMRRLASVVLLLTVPALAPSPARAQQGPPQPVKWSLSLEPESGQVAAGSKLVAIVTANIGEGWHVYAPDDANAGPRPVDLTLVKNPVFTTAGKLESPEPEREMDQAFGQITASYTEQAAFRLPILVAADAPAGTHALEIDVSFQACDGNICLPAKAARVKATVTVSK
jgi:DsbC/DsbD-like thiol-disulfide interchange protein